MRTSAVKQRTTAKQHRQQVVKGHAFDAKLETPHVVRIFLSSTFHDFLEERNYLFSHAFVELSAWCRERGLEFQVSDMRWGIRDSQSAAEVCLHEIEHCQSLSIGPNFVALVGDRYGRRPLPLTVPIDDFATILAHVQDDGDKQLLRHAYRLDENVIPPVQVLKPREMILSAGKDWTSTEQELSEILTDAVQTAHRLERIDNRHSYIGSTTEKEIHHGIISTDNPEHHTLCFLRSFQDIQMPAYSKNVDKLRRFADFLQPYENGQIDQVNSTMLHELKNFALPEKLDDTNLYRYSIPFDVEKGVNPENQVHRQYLENLSGKFVTNMKELISEGLVQVSKSHSSDAVYVEAARHALFAVKKSTIYCGRDKFLAKLYTRLGEKTGELRTNRPIVIYGDSGVGKTATIAKAVLDTWCNVTGVPNVVYRFLGTTPCSSNVHLLLKSLIAQISDIYWLDKQTNADDSYETTTTKFMKLLTKIDSSSRLIIILDSLDQLSSEHDAYSMSWLPSTLPENIKIVVSVMPEFGKILPRLRVILGKKNLLELTPISNRSAGKALVALLAAQRRTLQPAQLKLATSAFKKTQNPLFLHLVATEVSRWSSFDPMESLRLGDSLHSAISVLFDRLETQHGRTLVAHAMGYMVIAVNGMTEGELEEVLSLDNKVLIDVYQHWAPPVEHTITVPPLLWARLRYDMKDFIMNRQGDNTTVMGIYHKQFTEVINSRYLSDISTRRYLHSILAEFFAGTHSSKPKMIMLNLPSFVAERALLRRVREQPIRLAKGRYNIRKLCELPHHALNSGMFDHQENGQNGHEKPQHLLNFDWIEAKINACGISGVLQDYTAFGSKYDLTTRQYDDIRAIQYILRMTNSDISINGNNKQKQNLGAVEFAYQLLARLNGIAINNRSDDINLAIDRAQKYLHDQSSPTNIHLIPLNACLPSVDNPLRAHLRLLNNKSDGISWCGLTNDGTLLCTLSSDDADATVRVYDMSSDSLSNTIRLESTVDINAVAISNDVLGVTSRLLFLDNTGVFTVHNIATGVKIAAMFIVDIVVGGEAKKTSPDHKASRSSSTSATSTLTKSSSKPSVLHMSLSASELMEENRVKNDVQIVVGGHDLVAALLPHSIAFVRLGDKLSVVKQYAIHKKVSCLRVINQGNSTNSETVFAAFVGHIIVTFYTTGGGKKLKQHTSDSCSNLVSWFGMGIIRIEKNDHFVAIGKKDTKTVIIVSLKRYHGRDLSLRGKREILLEHSNDMLTSISNHGILFASGNLLTVLPTNQITSVNDIQPITIELLSPTVSLKSVGDSAFIGTTSNGMAKLSMKSNKVEYLNAPTTLFVTHTQNHVICMNEHQVQVYQVDKFDENCDEITGFTRRQWIPSLLNSEDSAGKSNSPRISRSWLDSKTSTAVVYCTTSHGRSITVSSNDEEKEIPIEKTVRLMTTVHNGVCAYVVQGSNVIYELNGLFANRSEPTQNSASLQSPITKLSYNSASSILCALCHDSITTIQYPSHNANTIMISSILRQSPKNVDSVESVLSGEFGLIVRTKKSFMLIDEKGMLVVEYTLPDAHQRAQFECWTTGGKFVAYSDDTSQVTIVTLTKGGPPPQTLHNFTQLHLHITSLSLVNRGQTLIVGSSTLESPFIYRFHIVNVENGLQTMEIETDHRITSLAVHDPDGRRMTMRMANGYMNMYDIVAWENTHGGEKEKRKNKKSTSCDIL